MPHTAASLSLHFPQLLLQPTQKKKERKKKQKEKDVPYLVVLQIDNSFNPVLSKLDRLKGEQHTALLLGSLLVNRVIHRVFLEVGKAMAHHCCVFTVDWSICKAAAQLLPSQYNNGSPSFEEILRFFTENLFYMYIDVLCLNLNLGVPK